MSTTTQGALTILFTDVEGSTELLSRAGDQAATVALQVHEEIVRDAIRQAGGRERSFQGDGFLATFPEPRAALRCAVDTQRRLDAHSQRDPDRAVRVRIGIHHGVTTERGGQLYGRDVHAAARVMAEAAGGEIFVSRAVRDASPADDGTAFVDRGLFWLKGFPERWRLWEVEWRVDRETVGARAAPRRTLAPFVGRDVERADLRKAVRSALAGQGGLALVSGEAGVGKSRLVEEVAAEAAARGMRVLEGHSVQMEGGLAYLPFIEILEQALIGPRSPIALRTALGDGAAEIARLVPGLRRVLPDLPPPLELPPEQARRFLWGSIEEFFRRASQDRPLLLVLEDLHWADESSMLLLVYLGPLLSGMPVLMLGTYRDTELGSAQPLARAINELTRRRLVSRTSLKRLSNEGVAAMIEGLAGQPPPQGLVRTIHAETEGNPFFVEEVFLHLSESGQLLDPTGRFRADLRIGELDVPESVRLVVGGRLERLSVRTRDALAAAAVSGRAFDPAIVGIVAGLDPEELAGAFDEAERARVVAPPRSDDTGMSFVHELIRQTLLADTSSLKRQQLHARTAAAIEEVHADEIESHAADLAYHLSRAGPRVALDRMIRYLRIAGERAVRSSAFEDAAAHYDHALSLAGSSSDQTRAELLEGLAGALRSVGKWDDALATMDRAMELYQRMGRTEAIGRLCWAMVYHLTWAARFEEAVVLAGRGLAALGESWNPDRARLLSVTGWVTGLAGDHGAATGLFETARSLARELGDRRALADVLHMQAPHHLGYAEFAQGIAAGREAAEVFESEGELWDLCGVLGFVEFQEGTILHQEEAAALAVRMAPLAARLGHVGAEFLVLGDRVRSDGVMSGDLARTEALARELIEVCRRGNLPWLYTGHLYLGLAAHWGGRWDDAERELRRAMELEPPGAFGGQSAMHLALHLAELGSDDAVMELFEKAAPNLAAPGRVNSLGAWNTLFGFTEALFVIGRRAEAAALGALVAEALAHGEWITFDCRFVRTRAGIAAAARGRWDEGEAHFAGALELAKRLRHRIEAAGILRLRARMLRDRDAPGDAEQAAQLTREAVELFREMGMGAMAAHVEARLSAGPAADPVARSEGQRQGPSR